MSSIDPAPGTVLLTRPTQNSAQLQAMLERNRWQVQCLPMLEIEPLTQRDSALFAPLFAEPGSRCMAIFISVNAVRCTAALLQEQNLRWPAGVACAGIGQATLAALAAEGWPPLSLPAPLADEGQDSEAMLQRLLACGVAQAKVLLFCGQGGRRVLQERLADSGAEVVRIETYRRLKPVYSEAEIADALRAFLAGEPGQIRATLFASGETLANFCEYLRPAPEWAQWRALPSIVPGQRVAEIATGLGLGNVVIAGNASAGAFLRALTSLHNASRCKL